MLSLLRNIARQTFLEVLNARRVVSVGQTFIRGGNVFRVSCHFTTFIDPHQGESHREQRRNFPYIVFAAASSKNTEEDSLSTSSESQSFFVTTPSPPSRHLKRSGNSRFAKAAKGTSNKMALMTLGYCNCMAKEKLDFENTTEENEPPSKCNTRTTHACTEVILYLYRHCLKNTKHPFIVIIGNIIYLCLRL